MSRQTQIASATHVIKLQETLCLRDNVTHTHTLRHVPAVLTELQYSWGRMCSCRGRAVSWLKAGVSSQQFWKRDTRANMQRPSLARDMATTRRRTSLSEDRKHQSLPTTHLCQCYFNILLQSLLISLLYFGYTSVLKCHFLSFLF